MIAAARIGAVAAIGWMASVAGLGGPAAAQSDVPADQSTSPQALFQMFDAFNAARASYALCGDDDTVLQAMFGAQYDRLQAELAAMMADGLPDLSDEERAGLVDRRTDAVARQIAQAHAAEGCDHEGVDSFAKLYRVFAVAERDG